MSKKFPKLGQSYLTILEIGGSHAHRLRDLIEHLGLVTLVITDLDSAQSTGGQSVRPARGKAQVTRNTTLRTWHPQIEELDGLMTAGQDQKVKKYDEFFSVRVAYQFPLDVRLNENGESSMALPYTFEDALVFENLDVFRNLESKGTIGKIKDSINEAKTVDDLGERLFELLKSARKAELALELLALEQDPWPVRPPTYIREGLEWLQEHFEKKQPELVASSLPLTTQWTHEYGKSRRWPH